MCYHSKDKLIISKSITSITLLLVGRNLPLIFERRLNEARRLLCSISLTSPSGCSLNPPTGLNQYFSLCEPSDVKEAAAASFKQGSRQGEAAIQHLGGGGGKAAWGGVVRLSLLGLRVPKAKHSPPRGRGNPEENGRQGRREGRMAGF